MDDLHPPFLNMSPSTSDNDYHVSAVDHVDPIPSVGPSEPDGDRTRDERNRKGSQSEPESDVEASQVTGEPSTSRPKDQADDSLRQRGGKSRRLISSLVLLSVFGEYFRRCSSNAH